MASDRERRENLSRIRHEAGRGMEFYRPGGSLADEGSLINADGLRWLNSGSLLDTPTIAEVARDLGVNDEVLRLTLIGKREPSKAFLDAVGYERVVLYRPLTKGPSNG